MPAADPVDVGPQEAVGALLSTTGRTNPYPYYDVLRTQAPVLPFGNFVILSRYADCDRVLRDPIFEVEHEGYLDLSFPGWREHSSVALLRESMLFAPSSAHERLRKLAGHAFTQRRIAELRDTVTELATAAAGRLAELGAGGAPVDFMAEFAVRLPVAVAGELLGVPADDRAWLRTQVTKLSVALEAMPNEDEIMVADGAADQLRDYLAEQVAQRRRSPRSDLISALVDGSTERELSGRELTANLVLLLAAGFETTSNLLGNGLAALLAHPDAMAALRDQPELAPSYVEEMLRYDTPVHVTSRWAEADTEISGVEIARHREAILLLGSACRDPDRFEAPDRFLPERPGNQPLSFGAGPHFCLGAALARIQAQVAFPVLLNRFPGLATAAEPVRRDRLTMNGYAELPIGTTG
ncbi:cytochrome P450 [Amycolatopsis cihanbeyliensis]|uniref:Cytochrome P450 n=1 Tax=Amycolatopsis cihanbeyliensis TaxID=1128664 RepID=A0A542DRZ6_AMYCI|nr:cytochrome P450 [Amycolatopsis cihanbeyliensis]TQJ05872.1 cytochrome P450 [Amycolatopsis cihanbeyliensis]